MSNNKYNAKITNPRNMQNSKENNNQNENGESNIFNLGNKDVLDYLIKLSGNQEVYKELKEKTGKIEKILSQSKQKLSNINLYENQKLDKDIYQWNNLFNNSIPITAYVASSSYIKNLNNKMQKEDNKNTSYTKNEKDSMKRPIILVDLTEEEIKKYLPPEPIGEQPSSVIRFQQLPFKGDSSNVFYFSNAFNDYYKMDFKEFTNIMRLLKAKKKYKIPKLNRQIKEINKNIKAKERINELIKKKMKNPINNLDIDTKYVPLSLKKLNEVKNIEPLMNSIFEQIHSGQDMIMTKNNKLYMKSNKPLGSERDKNSIDYSVNDREHQRNELNRIKQKKKRPNSELKRKLILSSYDENDPDISVFKKLEILDDNFIEEEYNDNNDNKINIDNHEKYLMDSERCSKDIIDIEQSKNINNKEQRNSFLEESQNMSINKQNKLNKKRINSANFRTLSSQKSNSKNRNFSIYQRSISAYGSRLANKKDKPFIRNVYLSSNNRLINSAFYKRSLNGSQIMNDTYEEKFKGNSSSQISTYDGINNSLYDNNNGQRCRFPYKYSNQIKNKMYQKINERLRERQSEIDKQRLEIFSRLIYLDDSFLLSNKFYKDKLNNSNINIRDTPNQLISNKSLTADKPKQERKEKVNLKNKFINLDKSLTKKILKYSHSKNRNNFRTISKKSSNENSSKIDFTTSILNTKHDLMFNHKDNNGKVSFIYFNDIIKTIPQRFDDGKPIIKNDRIIAGTNYYNRVRPQLLYNKFKYSRNTKILRRVQSSKISSFVHKLKNNAIIHEENL